MNHKLRIVVLQQLSIHPRSGYGLIREINAATGWKPSYGSIYPLLDQFKQEQLVTCKEEGKKKIYTLTKKGETAVKELENQHANMVTKMRENHRLMAHMCGMKDDPIAEPFFEAIERGEQPFRQIMKETKSMKAEIARLFQQNLLDKHKNSINKILKETTQKLKVLK